MTEVIPNTESASLKTELSYGDDFYMWVKVHVSKTGTVISRVLALPIKHTNCSLKIIYQHYYYTEGLREVRNAFL